MSLALFVTSTAAAAGLVAAAGVPVVTFVRHEAMTYELSAVARYARYDFLLAQGGTVHASLSSAVDAWSPTLGVPTVDDATITYAGGGVCLTLTATAVAMDELRTEVSDC